MADGAGWRAASSARPSAGNLATARLLRETGSKAGRGPAPPVVSGVGILPVRGGAWPFPRSSPGPLSSGWQVSWGTQGQTGSCVPAELQSPRHGHPLARAQALRRRRTSPASPPPRPVGGRGLHGSKFAGPGGLRNKYSETKGSISLNFKLCG